MHKVLDELVPSPPFVCSKVARKVKEPNACMSSPLMIDDSSISLELVANNQNSKNRT